MSDEQATLLDKCEELLVDSYRALQRGNWADGETQEELCKQIFDVLFEDFHWQKLDNQRGE